MVDYTVFICCILITWRNAGVNCSTAEDITDWRCLAKVTQRTIQELRWVKAAIIHDRHSDFIIQKSRKVQLVTYEIDDETSLSDVLQEINALLFPDVNVVVAVDSVVLLRKIIYQADVFDKSANHSTDFSHHSIWLALTKNISMFLHDKVKVANLQNIALFSFRFQTKVCPVKVFSLTSVAEGFRFLPVDPALPLPRRLFPNTKYGYNGRTLRVSTVESTPFVIASGEPDSIPYTGFFIDILHLITGNLNLTVEYVPAEDGVWGWIYNGMVGQLNRREIDLAASDLTVHAERARHVNFITPYLYTDERVFSYKMAPTTHHIFLLAGPLKLSVYLVYLGVGFLVIILIVFVESFWGIARTVPSRRAGYLFWDLLKPSFKQAMSSNIKNTPSRLLLIFWWMLVMLISTLYCGNLTATLATDTHLREFRSIDELVDSDFAVGFLRGGIMPQLLKNSPREDLNRVYKKFVRMNASDPNLTSYSKDFLMQRVKDGQYVFASFKSMVEHMVKGDCSLSMLYFGDKTKASVTFAVQRNSPFRDDIGKVIQKLESSGTLMKLWRKWSKHNETRTCESRKRNVSIVELLGAVVVAGAGIGLASVALILEAFTTRWKQQ